MHNTFPLPAVGLSGGIGSGKSTVGRLMAALGVPVLDTDAVYAELVDSSTQLAVALSEIFGPSVVCNGLVHRARLREAVRAYSSKHQNLNAATHPLIMASLVEKMNAGQGSGAEFCVVEVPLLFETDWDRHFDATVYVFTKVEERWLRVQDRPGMSRPHFDYIRAHQIDPERACARADHVIRNDGSPEALEERVLNLHSLLVHRFS